jgi:hypothetical protein
MDRQEDAERQLQRPDDPVSDPQQQDGRYAERQGERAEAQYRRPVRGGGPVAVWAE